MYTFANIEKKNERRKRKRAKSHEVKKIKGVIAFIENSDVYVHCSRK